MQTDTVTFEVTDLCLKHATESVRNQTWALIPYGIYRWLPSAQHRANSSVGLCSTELFEMSKYRARDDVIPNQFPRIKLRSWLSLLTHSVPDLSLMLQDVPPEEVQACGDSHPSVCSACSTQMLCKDTRSIKCTLG